jgi:two-component system chemotaxis response regulator CheB
MDDIQVLVCDDSALMRNLISRIIEGTEGLKVAGTAMNGKFCLQKIPSLKPDIIVLDIEMPEMNGIQFLEERKKTGNRHSCNYTFISSNQGCSRYNAGS